MDTSFEIIAVAWKNIWKNPLATLKVIFPIALLLLLSLLLFIIAMNNLSLFYKIYSMPEPVVFALAVVVVLFLGILFSWIAVRYHRYVLYDEVPSWFGGFKAKLALSYFGYAIVVGLVRLFVVGIPVLIIIWLGISVLAMILAIPLTIISYYLSARLSPILVERALGKSRGMGEIWRMGKPQNSVFWALAVMIMLLDICFDVFDKMTDQFMGINGIFDWVIIGLSVVIAVIYTLFAISVITETYNRFYND